MWTGQLTHDIGLGTDGNKTVDVLADRHEDLSGHVTTLLGTRSLILNVNTGSTTLNKQLGQLHDGSQTTVTSVSVRNDGAQVVNVRNVGALLLGGGDTLLALFPVMEELGHEQVVDLVGDSVLHSSVSNLQSIQRVYHPKIQTHHRVVCKIGGGFIGRGGGRRALPARDIDGVQVLGHLGDHGGFETAIGEAGLLVLYTAKQIASAWMFFLIPSIN